MAAIHYATLGSHIPLLEVLLMKRQANVSTLASNDWSALHMAVSHGNIDICRLLLMHRAPVNCNICNDNIDSVLHLAVMSSNPSCEILELLLSHGADCNRFNYEDWTPLVSAADYGNSKCVNILLAVNSMQSDSLNLALNRAAIHGHLETVSVLLKSGAHVNSMIDGLTQLAHVVDHGQNKVLKLLLANGANVNPANCTLTDTPLSRAINAGHLSCVRLLVKNGGLLHSTYLVDAAEKGYYHIVDYLLGIGMKPDIVDSTDCTALLTAIEHNRNEVCELLLERGSDVGYPNHLGETGLHIASKLGRYRIVIMLLKFCSPEVLDRPDTLNGSTALHRAAFCGHQNTVQLLLGHGSSVYATNLQQDTPLHAAVRGRNTNIVKMMINAGADVDAYDRNGNTALHMAARDGQTKMMKLLLNVGAKLTNCDRWTILHSAAACGLTDLCRCILNESPVCDVVNALDEDGQSPLHVAAIRGHSKTMRLLLRRGASTFNRSKLENCTPLSYAMSHNYIQSARMLIRRQLVLYPSATKPNLLETEQFYSDPSLIRQMQEFFDKTVQETQHLAETIIPNTTLSLLTLLQASEFKITTLMQNHTISEYLQKKLYEQKITVYREDIRRQINLGQRRRACITSARIILVTLFEEMVPGSAVQSTHVIDEILMHLDYNGLKKMRYL